MRKLTLLTAAALFAAPIFAADPLDGWYFGAGAGFISSSDNTVIATTYNRASSTNNAFSKNHRLDYGSQLVHPVQNVWFGYKSSWGDLRFSYWGYSHSANSHVRGTPRDWATFSSFDLYGQGYDDLDTSSHLKTRQFDLDWAHEITSGDKGTLNWSLGLRKFNTERAIAWRGTAYNSPGVVHSIAVAAHGSEAKGFGITTGLSGTIKFNDRFSLDSELKVGYVNGSITYALDEEGIFFNIYSNRFSDSHKNQSFRTSELSLHGNVMIWKGLSAYLGYENRRQEGVLGAFDATQYFNTYIQDFKTSDLTYSGIVLGANWKF